MPAARRVTQGRAQTVSHDVLTVFLERLGLPAASASQRAESAARLAQASGEPALAIGAAGQTLRVRGQPGTAVIELDSGAALAVQAEADHDGFVRIVHKFDWDVIRKIDQTNGVTYDCK